VIDYEFYETPEAFTRYLFRRYPTPIGSRLFAPCVGSGAIPRVACECGADDWQINDLDPRWSADSHLDARKPHLWEEVEPEWTIDNPPFGPVMEILPLALKHSSHGVAFHLRASIHEPLRTPGDLRRMFLHQHPPTGILWLPRFGYQRSPSTGKWSTDSVTACWVIWEKGATSQFIDYADEQCHVELAAETPAYRARMDALMAARAAA